MSIQLFTACLSTMDIMCSLTGWDWELQHMAVCFRKEDEGEAAQELIQNHVALQRMQENRTTAKSAVVVDQLVVELGLSERTVLRHLECIAEKCWTAQNTNLENVLHYVRSLPTTLRAVAFFFHQRYDETPLRLRVSFSMHTEAEPQVTKLYVLDSQWSLLLRRLDPANAFAPIDESDYLCIYGAWSTCLRATDTGTGEAIATVLRSGPHPPPEDSVLSHCHKYRLAEADEGAANGKAERLYQTWLETTQPGFNTLLWVCSAHKVHAIADKVWSLSGEVLSGVCAVLLAVQTSQQLAKLKHAIEDLVQETFQWEQHDTLSPSAQKYRKSVLDLYLPHRARHPTKRCRILSMAMVINGDWQRKGVIVHRCVGDECCGSRQEALSKVTQVLFKVINALRPGRLCRGNWADWPRPLAFVGVLGHVHGLLPDAFARAFRAPVDQTLALLLAFLRRTTFELILV
eukprot:4079615-Amphidinium_carterae.3